jgi:ABC-type multidrug transport system permease subunit
LNEIVIEIGLRAAKIVLAALIGVVIYVVLAGLLGVAGSPQLALESWIAGALVVLLLETSAF